MNSSRKGIKNQIKVTNFSGYDLTKVEEDKENINLDALEAILRYKNSVGVSSKEIIEREFGKDLTGYLMNVGEYKEHFQKARSQLKTEKDEKGGNTERGQTLEKLNREKINKRNGSLIGTGGQGQLGSSSSSTSQLYFVKDYQTNPPNNTSNTLKNIFKKDKAPPKLNNAQPTKFIPNHPNTSKNRDISLNSGNFFNPVYLNTNQYDKNMKINNFIRQQKKNSSFALEYPCNGNFPFNIIHNKNNSSITKNSGIKCSNLQSEAYLNKKIGERSKSKRKLQTIGFTKPHGLNKDNLELNVHTYDSDLNGNYHSCSTNGTSSVQSQMMINNNCQVEIQPDAYQYLLTEEFYTNESDNINAKTEKIKLVEDIDCFGVETNHKEREVNKKQTNSVVITNFTFTPTPLAETKFFINPELKEYAQDILQSLKEEESEQKNGVKYGYMSVQNDINEQMRSILVDWIVEVHLKFNLRPETLFLTVSLIDRYLSTKRIPRAKLQLLGVASMLIACKHEEIYTPHVKDFVYITDKAYSRDEVLAMEQETLNTLQFEILTPTSLRILELIAYFFGFTMKQFMFARYLLEISLVEYNMTKYSPGILSCSAAYITMKFFKFQNYQLIYSPAFNPSHSQSTIKECAKDICFLIDTSAESNLTAVKRKFAKKDYFEVSSLSF